MPIKIGDIDIVQQSLNNEYQVRRLTRLVQLLLDRTNITVTYEDVNKINTEALQDLQKEYPNSGIEIKTKGNNNASNR